MNVFLKHGRYSSNSLISDKNPRGLKSTGGITIAVLNNGNEFKWGISKCNLSDTFSKRLGVVRATGRANSKLAFKTTPYSKEELAKLVDDFIFVSINHGVFPRSQDDFEFFLDQIIKGIGITNG